MASSETARWIGSRLRSERSRLELSQRALADRADVSQAAVALWEKGQRTPGVEELLRLAAALGVDVSDFLPREARLQPIRAVLRAEAFELEQGELAAELERVIGAAERTPPPATQITIEATDPRAAAELLLLRAGVTRPPIEVAQLAEKCGVRVIPHELPEALSGALLQLEDGAVITVNEGQFPGRQRFTIAHELGHLLLRHHDRFHIDLSEPTAIGEPPGYNWVHEREANEFAASLLMPAGMMRDFVPKARAVRQLAERFGVSPMAVSYRLRNLGLEVG
jgi:Zn-dependent peptidase ImmA (M78 family)/DNA-binding XRE family transcriptional regulator